MLTSWYRLGDRAVAIVVGEEKRIFDVHEDLIRASSAFFDRAMAGPWKEAQDRTVSLPDDDPEIFALYVHWLYYGTLPVCCDEPGLPGNAEYLALVKAYILGDKILDYSFQNAAIEAMVEKSHSTAQDGKRWYPVGEVIEFAYDHTNPSDLLRELLVDMYASYGKSGWLDEWGEQENVPQSFLLKLASRLLDTCGCTHEPLDACNYQSHGSSC